MTYPHPETSWASLQQVLIERYDDLRRRLARRVGSAELAGETLNELYIRMSRPDSVGVIRNPSSFLLVIAHNLALTHWQKTSRRGPHLDIGRLFELADETPGPDRIAEARSEIDALDRALARLPPRQRAVLIAVRYDGLTHAAVAARLGVSSRTVQLDLNRALAFCLKHVAARAPRPVEKATS